eukprot:COSAG02_NODE_24896_length_674_cov_2.189565_1_plen_179_part_10
MTLRTRLPAQQLPGAGLIVRMLQVALELALLWTVVQVATHVLRLLRPCVQRTAATVQAIQIACRLERARTQRTELLSQRVVQRHIYLPVRQPIYSIPMCLPASNHVQMQENVRTQLMQPQSQNHAAATVKTAQQPNARVAQRVSTQLPGPYPAVIARLDMQMQTAIQRPSAWPALRVHM